MYLVSRDAECSSRRIIGNARQRIDVIISHQALQKQTWQSAGKCVENRRKPKKKKKNNRTIKSTTFQTSYGDIGIKAKTSLEHN